MLELFLPDVPGLLLEKSYVGDKRLLLFLSSTGPSAICPKCQTVSFKVHSHYSRIVADLPWAEIAVRFLLRVRRFFCHNLKCKRVTFAERLGSSIPAYARRTQRRTNQLQSIGLALGGEAGARLAKELGIASSPDTILDLVRAIPLPKREGVRILGMDDWAIRKGQTYATILLDLEQHQIVDLLPNRESATVVKWLQTQPQIEVISRDRSVSYAEAARLGAPQALQVVDRFHLFKNLGETVEKILRHNYSSVRQILDENNANTIFPSQNPGTLSDLEIDTGVEKLSGSAKEQLIPKPIKLKKPTWQQKAAQARLEHRQQVHEQVKLLHSQGYNQSQIEQELQISRRRIRELLRVEGELKAKPFRPRRSKLDEYKPYLLKRLFEDNCNNATLLWEELKNQGYVGGHSYVIQYVGRLRKQAASAGFGKMEVGAQTELGSGIVNQKLYSASQLFWWFILPPEKLRASQLLKLSKLCQSNEKLALTYQYAQDFKRLFEEKRPDKLEGWLEQTQQSGISEWISFSRGLRRDAEAIKASITLKWSQGPVEGMVNKIKLVKRSMFGKASLDLLKVRVMVS